MLCESLFQRGHHIRRRFQPNNIIGDRECQLHRLDQQLPLSLTFWPITRVRMEITVNLDNMVTLTACVFSQIRLSTSFQGPKFRLGQRRNNASDTSQLQPRKYKVIFLKRNCKDQESYYETAYSRNEMKLHPNKMAAKTRPKEYNTIDTLRKGSGKSHRAQRLNKELQVSKEC